MNAAPAEFIQSGLEPSDFRFSDKKSWRGPCLNCGGTRRFVMFTDHEFPYWNGFCDECGYKIRAWEKVKVQYDPQKVARIQAERAREETQLAEKRRAKLAEFTTHEIWNELHERMTENNIDWWESQGIPKCVQDYLHLGYIPDKPFYNDDKVLLHSPAYTIPWFGNNFSFNTMQYRLLANVDRRYIFENGLGGGRFYYMTTPDKPITDKVIICEGAKKAIVTQFWLAPDDSYTVIGASSANTFGAALEATKSCGLRYVITDPGSEIWSRRAVETNPKTTHSVRLPFKLDDGWMNYGLDREKFANILSNAI